MSFCMLSVHVLLYALCTGPSVCSLYRSFCMLSVQVLLYALCTCPSVCSLYRSFCMLSVHVLLYALCTGPSVCSLYRSFCILSVQVLLPTKQGIFFGQFTSSPHILVSSLHFLSTHFCQFTSLPLHTFLPASSETSTKIAKPITHASKSFTCPKTLLILVT